MSRFVFNISTGQRGRLLAAAFCTLPVVVFNLSFFNHYFPITEGWFSGYAELINRGLVPYRDFDLLLPPLYVYEIALVQRLFGDSILALRWIGVIVMMGMSLALFAVLDQLFRPWIAAAGAATAIIYYQKGTAFIGYDFTQFLTLFALTGLALLLGALRGQSRAALFASGAAIGATALIKHSNGAMISAFMLLALVLAWPGSMRARTMAVVHWLLGWSVPVAVTLLALLTGGALHDFYDNVFVSALAAKGGRDAVLFQWLNGLLRGGYLFHTIRGIQTLAMAAAAVAGIAIVFHAVASLFASHTAGTSPSTGWRGRVARLVGKESRGTPLLLAGFLLLLAGVPIALFFHPEWNFEWLRETGTRVDEMGILLALNTYLVCAAPALAFVLFGGGARWRALLAISVFGLGLVLGNGTSGGLSEISAFVGVALVLCALIRLGAASPVAVLAPLVIMFGLATQLVETKYASPYAWWTVRTPDVRTTKCGQASGVLAGLCMGSDDAAKIDAIVQAVRTHAGADRSLYVFPHMPVFYSLSGMAPYENAVVSWYDFMSTTEAIRIARRLAAAPPGVIVVAQLPELVASTHERLFRGGGAIGQRQITEAIGALQRDGRIAEVGRVTALNATDIVVYARR